MKRLMACIAAVETGNHALAVGRHGERTEYQMKREVWERYTMDPFSRAGYLSERKQVAVCWAAWLQRQLLLQGQSPTVTLIAQAWKQGLNGVAKHHVTPLTRDYARCVLNLYEDPEFEPTII
jgi:hypothetical protein